MYNSSFETSSLGFSDFIFETTTSSNDQHKRGSTIRALFRLIRQVRASVKRLSHIKQSNFTSSFNRGSCQKKQKRKKLYIILIDWTLTQFTKDRKTDRSWLRCRRKSEWCCSWWESLWLRWNKRGWGGGRVWGGGRQEHDSSSPASSLIFFFFFFLHRLKQTVEKKI